MEVVSKQFVRILQPTKMWAQVSSKQCIVWKTSSRSHLMVNGQTKPYEDSILPNPDRDKRVVWLLVLQGLLPQCLKIT